VSLITKEHPTYNNNSKNIFTLEPLMTPSTTFTPYAASEYQTTTEPWKPAPGHPGLMKDPPIVATRNGQANFVAQGQQQQVN
jgi:hypothetical protein